MDNHSKHPNTSLAKNGKTQRKIKIKKRKGKTTKKKKGKRKETP
jgi:hypothetical protein